MNWALSRNGGCSLSKYAKQCITFLKNLLEGCSLVEKMHKVKGYPQAFQKTDSEYYFRNYSDFDLYMS